MAQLDNLFMTHLRQASLVVLLCLLVARIAEKRLYFCYLILMLAIVKCLIPPLLPGPMGMINVADTLVF